MKRNILLSLMGLALSAFVNAQNVGIGASDPDASSILEVRSTGKGILIPRVSLTSQTDVTTIASPAFSLLVFNNNASLPDGQGFYFWNGNKWIKLATIVNLANLSWAISGNSGTGSTNFIGTTDNQPLIFKTNNILSGKIDPGPNNVFLGQSAGLVTTGTNNTFLGHTAGEENLDGINNTGVGNSSLSLNTSGIQNTAVGSFALDSTTTGENNTGLGVSALRSNSTGDNNTAIGVRAMFSLKGFRGDNVAVGYEAGKDAECIGCTFIGADATTSSTSLIQGATAIGEGAIVDDSYTMVFGSTNVGGWAFGKSSVASFRAIEVGTNANNGNGAYLTSAGVWTNISDVHKKEDFSELDPDDLLQKISSLPITKWKYKGSNEYHIGPTAQDFHRLFGLGVDDKGISTIDPGGIALAAIKEQQKIIQQQNELIQQLLKRVEVLESK